MIFFEKSIIVERQLQDHDSGPPGWLSPVTDR